MNAPAAATVTVPDLPVLGAMLLAAAAVLLAPRPRVGDDPGGPAGQDLGPRRAHVDGWWPALRRRLATPSGRAADRTTVEEILVLDGLAAALEAGLHTGRALHLVLGAGGRPGGRTCWDELRRAAGEGQPLAPVWSRVARRTGSATLSAVARAWTVAAATGAPLAAAVRASAEAARERRRLHRAVEVATAGARATVRVLALLPLAGVGLASLLGIGPRDLYAHPLAAGSAGAGVLLLGVGRLMVGRLVAGVVRRVA